MFLLNSYLLCSLIVFLRLTKEYIEPCSHLCIVLSFIIIFILINSFSDVIEVNIQQYDVFCLPSTKHLFGIVEWIRQDYSRSKTKQSIDTTIKYFLFVIQNIYGYKT
jgi:hypothetical protein